MEKLKLKFSMHNYNFDLFARLPDTPETPHGICVYCGQWLHQVTADLYYVEGNMLFCPSSPTHRHTKEFYGNHESVIEQASR